MVTASATALGAGMAGASPARASVKATRYMGKLPGGRIDISVRRTRVTITFQTSTGWGDLPSGAFPPTVTKLRNGRFSTQHSADAEGTTDESQSVPRGTLTIGGQRAGARITGKLRYEETSISLFPGTPGRSCAISRNYSARRQ